MSETTKVSKNLRLREDLKEYSTPPEEKSALEDLGYRIVGEERDYFLATLPSRWTEQKDDGNSFGSITYDQREICRVSNSRMWGIEKTIILNPAIGYISVNEHPEKEFIDRFTNFQKRIERYGFTPLDLKRDISTEVARRAGQEFISSFFRLTESWSMKRQCSAEKASFLLKRFVELHKNYQPVLSIEEVAEKIVKVCEEERASTKIIIREVRQLANHFQTYAQKTEAQGGEGIETLISLDLQQQQGDIKLDLFMSNSSAGYGRSAHINQDRETKTWYVQDPQISTVVFSIEGTFPSKDLEQQLETISQLGEEADKAFGELLWRSGRRKRA